MLNNKIKIQVKAEDVEHRLVEGQPLSPEVTLVETHGVIGAEVDLQLLQGRDKRL